MVVVVADDGSVEMHTPGPEWAARIERVIGCPVIVLRNPKNEGIERTLNRGLEYILREIRPKYVARLDCRDMNASGRLDVQFRFMEEHQKICLLGSWADVVEEGKRLYTIRVPETHRQIKKRMFTNNSFVHPTVMMRMSAIEQVGYYPLDYPAAEDYAYFFRFVHHFETRNIQQALVRIVKPATGISIANRRAQLISRMRVIRHNAGLSVRALWGIVRTLILLVIPTRVVERVKRIHERLAHY